MCRRDDRTSAAIISPPSPISQISSVIDGIGLSNDGGGRHLLLPNPAGQLRAYELAYAQAGCAPSDIDYLECHATGTPAGDRTEAETVATFFGGHGKVPIGPGYLGDDSDALRGALLIEDAFGGRHRYPR